MSTSIQPSSITRRRFNDGWAFSRRFTPDLHDFSLGFLPLWFWFIVETSLVCDRSPEIAWSHSVLNEIRIIKDIVLDNYMIICLWLIYFVIFQFRVVCTCVELLTKWNISPNFACLSRRAFVTGSQLRQRAKKLSRGTAFSKRQHARPATIPFSLRVCVVWLDSSQNTLWESKDPYRIQVDSEDWSTCADAQADLSLH